AFIDLFDVDKASDYKWGIAYSEELIKITIDVLSRAINGYAALLRAAIKEAGVEPPDVSLTMQSFLKGLKIPIYWLKKKLDKRQKKKATKKIEKEYRKKGDVFKSLSKDDKTVVKEYKYAKDQHKDWIDWPSGKRKSFSKKSGPKASSTPAKEKEHKTIKQKEKPVKKEPRKDGRQQKTKKLKYYLHLEDDIEEAPEIGGRTADKLKNIEINLVKDLLNMSASEVASKLNNRYIQEDDVKKWQIESRLMIDIPGTRVHDVKIMYKIGITDKKDLLKYKSEELLKLALKAADELGERAIQKSVYPDLEEVSEWIENAK
ncbi:MAG: DUF4332 domain-containing protein, partial [Promethearchaeota archaeon]